MKNVIYKDRVHKFVNEKTVNGKTYTAYRYRIRKTPEVSTIVVCGDRVTEIDDLKKYWQGLNG